MKYKHVVLGGTFDHFHRGHERLIAKALELSDTIALGLATEKVYKGKILWQFVEPYEKRKSAIEDFLMSKKFTGSFDIIPIFDIYGTTLTERTFEAIIVTEDTFHNAKIINTKRQRRGLRPLDIVTVDFVRDEKGNKITSEQVRLGQIDRNGQVYLSSFAKRLHLPEGFRKKLRTPLGQIFEGQEDNLSLAAEKCKEAYKKGHHSLLITVGDISTKSLRDSGLNPDVAVIDHRSLRKAIRGKSGKGVINPAGRIYPEAACAIYNNITDVINNKKGLTLDIKGEEDLLTLPAVLLSPLRSMVVYGQYKLGLVGITVDEEKKTLVRQLLRHFS